MFQICKFLITSILFVAGIASFVAIGRHHPEMGPLQLNALQWFALMAIWSPGALIGEM